MPKRTFWALAGLLLGALTGCGQEGSHESSSAPSSLVGAEIRFQVPFVNILDLLATLEISGVGTYPMTVNSDGTVSATVSGIGAGWHTFTVTYWAQGVILARAYTSAEVIAGQSMTLVFHPQELDRNFDEDSDGWVNLDELLWGSDPLVVASHPPGEDPRRAFIPAGGQIQSPSYAFYTSVGAGVAGQTLQGGPYTVKGGFQAYP